MKDGQPTSEQPQNERVEKIITKEINRPTLARWVQDALEDNEVREALRSPLDYICQGTGMARKVILVKPYARLIERLVGVLSARSANQVFEEFRRMSARFVAQALSLSIGLLLCLLAHVEAADLSKVAKQGKMVLQEKCGRCHAIEAVGESPLKEAPPMRDIYARFNPLELQAELSEGMVSRHRDMPQIEFSDEDVYAILTYLYALAVKK